MPGIVALVDAITMTIEPRSGGSIRLEDVISFDVTTTQESRPVYTLRRDRTPRGFRHGARTIAGTFEIALPQGGLEFDFERAQETKEFLNAQVERGEGGVRKTVVDMLITEVQETSNGEGEHMLRCSFVAGNYRSDAPGLNPL